MDIGRYVTSKLDKFRNDVANNLVKSANTVVNTKFLPGQVNTLGQVLGNVQKQPERYVLSSALQSGAATTGSRTVDRYAGGALNVPAQYAKNQVVNNLVQGVQTFQQPGVVNKGMGAAQVLGGLWNATPGGIVTSSVIGGVTGGLKSARTGENPLASMNRAITNPTSLTKEGLGIDNPLLAFVGDIALTRNPKSIIKDPVGLKSFGNLVKNGFPVKTGLRDILASKTEAVDALKRYETTLGDMSGSVGTHPLDIKLYPDLVKHWKTIYGANKKPPQNINQIAEEVKDGLRAALSKQKKGELIGLHNEGDLSLNRLTPGRVNETIDSNIMSSKTYYRGEPTGYGKPFGSLIKTDKYGVPRTSGGNHGIPTSTDVDYVTRRFAGEKGTVMQYVPKREVKVLDDPQEIMRLAGVKSATDFFWKGTGNRIPAFEAGAWFRKAKEAGYDAVDLSKIERMNLDSPPPPGVIRLGKTPENEVRILNTDAFEVRPHVAQDAPIGLENFDVSGLGKSKDTPQFGGLVGKAEAARPGAVQNPTDPFYNVKRMGVPESSRQFAKGEIERLKPQIEQVVGKTLSHDEVMKHAQVAKELSKTFTREETAQLGASSAALRNKIADLSKMNISSDEFTEALIRDKAFGAHLARLLGQRRITSDPAKKTILNSMIGEILKTGVDPEDVIKAAKNIDLNNPEQAAAFFRQYVKATPGQWVDKLRYNSMLSSPLTQINNFSSNAQGVGVITPVQKTVEGAIDALVSGVTGRERTRYAGEGAAYAGGYAANTKKAFENFLGVWTGKNPSTNPDTRFVPLATTTKGKIGEAILDVPTKALESVDQFFKTLTEGGLQSSNAYRLAKSGGKAAVKDVGQEAEELLFRGKLTKDGAGVVSNVIGEGGKWVKAGTQSKNKSIRWMAKLTLPFVNIGTNLAKEGAAYNPVLGTINMIGNSDKTAQSAKIAIGSAVTLLGASLAMSDRLTFGEDANRRDAQREAGIQPYSVKIGDTWVSYAKMHPAIGFQLATTAALVQAMKERRITESDAEVVANGAWNGLKFIADATYFKNVGDFVNTVGGDVEGVGKLIANYPSQAIPYRALMGWAARAIDTVQRKPDTNADFLTQTLQQLMTQVPGLSQQVPARLGPSGQPIPNQHPLINAVSPARISDENPQGVDYYTMKKEESRQTKEKNDLKKLAARDVNASLPLNQSSAMTAANSIGGTETKPSAYEQEVAKLRAQQTGQVQMLGDTLYIPKDGTVKTYSKSALVQAQQDADYSLTADRLKRADNSTEWVKITEDFITRLKAQQEKLDPLTDAAKITRTQNKIEDLMVQVDKYKQQGGFKKPKKISVPKIKLAGGKVPKIKTLKPKKVKLKTIKVANPKPVKLQVAKKR